MKKSLVALAAALALAGCTSSTRIEWGGKMAVRQPDGTVVEWAALRLFGARHWRGGE